MTEGFKATRILATLGMLAVAGFLTLSIQAAGSVGTVYANHSDCEDEAEERFDEENLDEDELDEALQDCDDEDEDENDDEDEDRYRLVQSVRQPILRIPRPVAVASAPAPAPAPVAVAPAPAPAPAPVPQLPRAGEGPLQQNGNSTLPLGAGLLVVAGLGLTYWRLNRSR